MDAVMKSRAVPPDKLLVYRFHYWAHAMTSASPRAKLHQYMNVLTDLWDTVPELSLLDHSIEEYTQLLWQAVKSVEVEARRTYHEYLATIPLSAAEDLPEAHQEAIHGFPIANKSASQQASALAPSVIAPCPIPHTPRLRDTSFQQAPLAAAPYQAYYPGKLENAPHFSQTVLSPSASAFTPSPLTEETFSIRLPVGVSCAIPIIKPLDIKAHNTKPPRIGGMKQFSARVSRKIPIVKPLHIDANVANRTPVTDETEPPQSRTSHAIPICKPPEEGIRISESQQVVQLKKSATAVEEKDRERDDPVDAREIPAAASRGVGVAARVPQSMYEFIKSFSPYATAPMPVASPDARDNASKSAPPLLKHNDNMMGKLLRRVCRADLEDGKQCDDESCREKNVHSCRMYARHIIHSNRPPCLHGGDGVEHMDENGDDVGHFRRNCKKRFGYSDGPGEGECNNPDCTYGHDHEAIRLPRQDTLSTPAAAQSSAAASNFKPVDSPTNDTSAYSFSSKGKARQISENFWATVPTAPAAMLQSPANHSLLAPKRPAHERASDNSSEIWQTNDSKGALAEGASCRKKSTAKHKRIKMVTAADDW